MLLKKKKIPLRLVLLCTISVITVSALTGCKNDSTKPSSAPASAGIGNQTTAVVPSSSATVPTTQPNIGASIEIDWDMNGALISADGTVSENISLTVAGTIQKEMNRAYLLIDILMKDNFPYYYEIPEPDGYISNDRPDQLSYYVSHYICYDKETKMPLATVFALDAEKEYIILHWNDGSGQYLVASKDPSVTPQEILTYFQEFVDRYTFRNPA